MRTPRRNLGLAGATTATVIAMTASVVAYAAPAVPPEAPTARTADARADRVAITAALNAWPRAWADRDADAVCGLFTRDVVFTFQGGPDRTYRQACQRFRAIIADPKQTVSYRRPAIESIAVDGDLAAVRLIWTVTITAADGTVLENAREKGLDVLRRRADGRWRISLSYAFPLA